MYGDAASIFGDPRSWFISATLENDGNPVTWRERVWRRTGLRGVQNTLHEWIRKPVPAVPLVIPWVKEFNKHYGDGLTAALRRMFGEANGEARLDQLDRSVVIAAYDTERRSPVAFFRSSASMSKPNAYIYPTPPHCPLPPFRCMPDWVSLVSKAAPIYVASLRDMVDVFDVCLHGAGSTLREIRPIMVHTWYVQDASTSIMAASLDSKLQKWEGAKHTFAPKPLSFGNWHVAAVLRLLIFQVGQRLIPCVLFGAPPLNLSVYHVMRQLAAVLQTELLEIQTFGNN